MAETTTLTLAEFLLARIAQDEEAARAAGRHWHLSRYYRDSTEIEDEAGEIVVYDEGAPREAQAQHIVRWDPARVLAECAAKRPIVTEHTVTETSRSRIEGGGPFYSCETCEPFPPAEQPNPGACLTLRLLALPYADHPDYREEWRA